jgi:hypothetical protein
VIVPLPEMILKNHFPDALQKVMLYQMCRISANLCPFRTFFNFGKGQKSQGLSHVNKFKKQTDYLEEKS